MPHSDGSFWSLQNMMDLLSLSQFTQDPSAAALVMKAYLLSTASGLLSFQLHAFTGHVAWTVVSVDGCNLSSALSQNFLAKNEWIIVGIQLWFLLGWEMVFLITCVLFQHSACISRRLWVCLHWQVHFIGSMFMKAHRIYDARKMVTL